MTVQQTSLNVYYGNIKPKLTEKQQLVYEVYKGNTALTDAEVGKLLGWEINHVSGRCGELREKGLLEFVERRPCRVNKNPANSYVIKNTPTKLHIF